MNQGNLPIPGQTSPGQLAPGRVIEKVERYLFPSGKVRQLRRLVYTVQDSTGVFRTLEQVEAEPPLDCSCVPVDMHDLAECMRCGSIVCATKHSFTCPRCGKIYCSACGCDPAESKDPAVQLKGKKICRQCEKEASETVIRKIFSKIWE